MRRAILAALLSIGLVPAAARAVPDGGIELVSRPTGFGPLPFDGTSYASVGGRAISADGCKIAFTSNNDVLSEQDDDTGEDVFHVDRCAAGQPVVLVSATPDGVPGNGESYNPTISADGKRIAFTTEARNLLPPGTKARYSVVVKDIPSGAVTLASRGDGPSGAAASAYEGILSADGGAVAFRADGVVDANNADGVAGASDVYVRFLNGDHTVMASAKSGVSGKADGEFDISGNGGRVAFASTTQFVPGDTDTEYDAYLADVTANGTVARQLVSGPQTPRSVALSQNGGTVAFADDRVWLSSCPASPCGSPIEASGPNSYVFGLGFPRSAGVPHRVFWFTNAALLPEDTNGTFDLYTRAFVFDALPSLSLPLGSPPGGTYGGDMTDDLSVVAAGSPSLDLPGTDGAHGQVFARAGGQTTLLSQPAGAAPRRNETSDTYVGRRGLSDNGRFVAMTTHSPALGAPREPGEGWMAETIVRDVVTGTTTLVSAGPDGAPANNWSTEPGIDRSGSRVAFSSQATNLAPGTTAKASHVYVRDLATGALQLVDHKPDGAPVANGAGHASLSADGTKVAFISRSPDLPSGGTYDHVYVADLATGTITLADQTATGTAALGSASDVVLDAAGGRVAFVTYAGNLGTSDPGDKVFVKDLRSGDVTYVSVPQSGTPDQNARGLSIDAAGDRVSWVENHAAFGYGSDGKPRVFVRDLAAGSTTLGSTGGAPEDNGDESGELDAAGTHLAFIRSFDNVAHPYLRDLATGVTQPLGADAFGASISPDGICVALNSNARNLIENGPGPDFDQVYLRAAGGTCAPRPDVAQPGGIGAGGADTTRPVISGLRMTRTRFAVRRRASAFVFSLSEDSRASVAIARCSKLRKRTCRRYRVVATLTRAHAEQGRNRIAFSGKIGSRKLKPGRYRATVGAVDAAGNRAVPRRVRFRIVRR
jgi:Tol biopolymer transport system component